jgi:HSP20 family protein
MKKTISKLALAAMLSTSLSANTLFDNPSLQNDDLVKMQSYFNNIVNQMMNTNLASINIVYPKVDMQNKKDKYVLKFELAGMDKNDINLSIGDDKVLTIQGEKKYQKDQKDEKYLRHESFYGKFKRVISLPKDADINNIKTKYENGILNVEIKKLKSKKPFYKSLKIN